jgi:hypothetical protein
MKFFMKKIVFSGIILALSALSILNWDLAKPDSKLGLFPLTQIEALSEGENLSTVAEQIELEGDLTPNRQRSFAQQPVQAFVNASYVSVNFMANLGPVVIHIYNGSGGLVFQQSVNASGGQQAFINIASFSTGNYTITFTNAQNQYMYGGFAI